MRKLSDVILSQTNNVLRSQANERNTISSINERIISPSGLKNNTKINKKNKKIKKTRLEACRREVKGMSLQEARTRIAYYCGDDEALSDLPKTDQIIIGICMKHIEDGHYQRHSALQETYTVWQEEYTDEQGYHNMRNRKITKEVCPKHDGRLWLNVSQAEIAKALGISRECVNRSIARLTKAGILEKFKYDKEVKGFYIDHTTALTLTKKYYRRLNARWASGRKNRIKTQESQTKKIYSLLRENNNINQGDWDSIESPPQAFFKKIQVSVFALCAYGNEVEERKSERYDARAMYCDLRYCLGWKMACPFLTKKISKWLRALQKQYFPTRGGWQSFLRVVNSTWHFIRDDFVLTLDWLLSFHAVRRILSGDFGIRKNPQNEYFVAAGLEKIKRVDAELRRQKLVKLEKERKTCQTRKKSQPFTSETQNYNNGSPSYATKLTRC